MRVGVPKEIKNHEYRAGLTPDSVRELVHRGHDVFVETGTGEAIGFTDDLYLNSGAEVVSSAAELFDVAELIIKVKEPQASEVELLTSKHTLFTYLHLAPDHDLTDSLIASGATCIAYETVTDEQGRLPLLAPMSEIAGRMAVQAGAHSLEMAAGGRGVLLSGAAGVPAAEVIILGGGVVGSNALAVAVGMGTVYSTRTALDEHLARADLVVGAVLLPGASAPKLIKHSHLHSMKLGSVIVDVAIDQGGCAETSRPTTHESPVFIEESVVHYCVANMPGAVARTSTLALNNATLPFIFALANHGVKEALVADTNLLNGLNVYRGELVSPEVAASQNRSFTDRLRLLSRS